MKRDLAMREARAMIQRGSSCVILIACSGSKEAGGVSWPIHSPRKLLDEVQPTDRAALFEVRRRLAPLAKAMSGPDVGDSSAQGPYLPAFERYTGTVYKRVDRGRWPGLGDSCVVIVSALYGLLFLWEPSTTT